MLERGGGLEQWITMRGEDRKNPVLLFLHGGPGDATNPWGYAGFRNWLKYFTVVQWDQRGAGRTFGRNGPAAASTITIDRMVQDGVELAELLSRRFQKDKIVLVGHSWGSILGVFMAKARPELFYALWVPVRLPTLRETTPSRTQPWLREPLATAIPGLFRSWMKLGRRHIRTQRASRCNGNGRICLKERRYFWHPPWGLR
jgi:pimeloyl-ACP methyl ester carboxylesterase